MKKPIHKRPLIWVLAFLILVGLIVSKIIMPEEFLEAQKLGETFAENFPERIAIEEGVNRVEVGSGTKGTIFLIHGSPGHWQDFARYLTDAELTNHFRLVAPDRPGYGDTFPGVAVGSMKKQAELLMQLTEGRPRPWIWAGHSFGTPIIARLAMDHPDHVDGLVFLAGAMSPEFEPQRWFHKLGNQSWIRRFLPEEIDVSNQEAMAFAAEFEAMQEDWERIVCPTLIVHGKKDWLAKYGHVGFAREKMTNARLEVVTLEEAGHLIIWDQYETIRKSLLRMSEWLTESNDQGSHLD
ncbi:MAG: alpha/beta hydrolase [Verrucomicrobiota bacterium]